MKDVQVVPVPNVDGEDELVAERTLDVERWVLQHEDTLRFRLIDPPRCYKHLIRLQLPPDVETNDRQGRYLRICQILLDILRAIDSGGYPSLATSIWMSLRRDRMPSIGQDFERQYYIDLPDTAREILSSPLILRCVDLFQLDWDTPHSFHQCWIIDRVMTDGHLWYGEAQASPFGKWCDAIPRTDDSFSGGPSMAAQDIRKSKSRSTVLSRQAVNEASMQHALAKMPQFGDEADLPDDLRLSFDTMAVYVQATNWAGNRDHQNLRHDLRGTLGAFDVDGPTTIAVPLDTELERLPHPPERSMSVCWTCNYLEPLRSEGSRGVNNITDVEGSDVARNRTEDLHPPEAAAADLEASSTQEAGRAPSASGMGPPPEGTAARFQVTGKVKGCWQQMEYVPVVHYEFF
jgi:hypothetical protein